MTMRDEPPAISAQSAETPPFTARRVAVIANPVSGTHPNALAELRAALEA
ncbi:MAG: hypothetical protein IT323_13005, partial [Anaerolineae bacterium]|nr:hypothetical protein [Anaerolineae bacterium]